MLELHAGNARAAISPEAGGRLASLVVRGRELLVGPAAADDRSLRWGCYLMAPWPGRLENGRFDWRGRTIQLPRTHGRHAIHGLVWDREWIVERSSASRARLACALPPAWPMGGVVRQSFVLAADRLTLYASVTAGADMPAALGWHPWFDRGGDVVSLRVDAGEVLETRRMIPTGRRLPVSGARDLRSGPLLGRRRLDHAYVAARSPAVLDWPGLRLTLDFDPAPMPVVVYTPPNAVCVEPQTALPNALALPPDAALAAGVRTLDPGETLTARLVLSWAVPTSAATPVPGRWRRIDR